MCCCSMYQNYFFLLMLHFTSTFQIPSFPTLGANLLLLVTYLFPKRKQYLAYKVIMNLEESITFCQSDLHCASFVAFEDMREKQQLCDVTINVQEHTLNAHRVILAAGIPYFRSLFTSSRTEPEETEIAIGELDPRALESVIHFAYSSKLIISFDNVHSLLQASEFLQLTQVKDACVEYLSNRLHVSNVLSTHTLAHRINNLQLVERSSGYIRQNFEVFSKSDDFLSMSNSSLKEIISGDDLNVCDEQIVYESVIKWVKVSPSQRQDVLPDILSEVRMIYLPSSYLIKNVASEELIKDSLPCRDLVERVKNYHLLPKEESAQLSLKTVPRKTCNMNSEVYAIFYSIAMGCYSMYVCDLLKETWNALKSKKLYVGRTFSNNAFAVDDDIYAFFGKKINILHLKTLEWEELEVTDHYCFSGATILSQGHLIYFFGSEHVSYINKAICFDSHQRIWVEVEKMKTGRYYSASALLEENIYVTGGCNPGIGKILNVVEKYETSTRKWSEVTPMLTARSHHGCATMNGKIYVFGGSLENVNSGNTAEVYDPLKNQWNFVSSMNVGRRLFSVIPYNGKIYVLGGQRKTSFIYQDVHDVEIYDPEGDKWTTSFRVPTGFQFAMLSLRTQKQ